MANIVIGNEFKTEFESIQRLYKEGYLSGGVQIRRVTRDTIETAANTFIFNPYERGVNGSDGSGEVKAAFKKDGATWFAPLRGVAADSSNADWEQLIMDVAADYHKHYSLIEFRQVNDSSTRDNEDRLVNRFKKEFIERVFTGGKAFSAPVRCGAEREDIYGISVRMEISSGTGESKPVLGKLYFSQSGRELAPLTYAEAAEIDSFLTASVPEDEGVKPAGWSDTVDVRLVGRVFDGLTKVIEDGGYAKYVCFGGGDMEVIRYMLDSLANTGEHGEIKKLQCSRIKVLGISHVQWEKSAYVISSQGREILKAVVGLNDTLSLICLNCSERGKASYLVNGNDIVYPADVKTAGLIKSLNPALENFGVSDEDVNKIIVNSEIKNHLFTVRCAENMRNPNCSRMVCASRAVEVKEGDKVVRKCKGCSYPEIVYSDIFAGGEAKYTPHLNFATDVMTLVPEKTETCLCCGRPFTEKKISKEGLCSFCSGSGGYTKAGGELYREYSGMLGLGVRLKHLFTKKYCREDGSVLLFVLGNDKYVFDKLNAQEFGFVSKPVKYRRYGGGRRHG